MARVCCGLRLCSLARACGEEVADTVGTAALTQALAAALRLPSRFPPSRSSSPFSGRHSSGVYLQAAKVQRVWGTDIAGVERWGGGLPFVSLLAYLTAAGIVVIFS